MPVDLSAFPEWQKLVRTDLTYRTAWLRGDWPPVSVRKAVQVASLRQSAVGRILGPGDHLHRLIYALTGEVPDRRCPCKDRMRLMNRWGVEGCARRVNEIADWLYTEAVRRGWKIRVPGAAWLVGLAPAKLQRVACKAMVRMAIRRAKRNRGQSTPAGAS